MKTGIQYDIPAAEYYASPALGSSAIKRAALESVAHCLADEYHETPAMRAGIMAHLAILEPDRFKDTYVIAPCGPCQGTTAKGAPCSKNAEPGSKYCWQHGGKEEAAAWHASLPAGTMIATQDEVETAMKTSEGVRAAIARSNYPDILNPENKREVTVCAWATLTPDGYSLSLDEMPGAILVKGRIDLFVNGYHAIDVKGTTKAGGTAERMFRYRVIDDGLLIQAVLYSDLIKCCTGAIADEICTSEIASWTWLVHEQDAPYAVRFYAPDPKDTWAARKQIAEGLRRWQVYFATDNPWDGWPTKKQTIYTTPKQTTAMVDSEF